MLYPVSDALKRFYFLQRCSQCNAQVRPTEAERDRLGWSCVYDHCGVTWTQWYDTRERRAR